jgi:hypothetical protein
MRYFYHSIALSVYVCNAIVKFAYPSTCVCVCVCVYMCVVFVHAQLLCGGAGAHAVKVLASRRNYRSLELGETPRLAAKLTSLCTALELPFHTTYWGSMAAGVHLNGECAHTCALTHIHVFPIHCALDLSWNSISGSLYKVGDFVDYRVPMGPRHARGRGGPQAARGTPFSVGIVTGMYACFEGCHGVVMRAQKVVARGQPRLEHVFFRLQRVEQFPKLQDMYVLKDPQMPSQLPLEPATFDGTVDVVVHVGAVGWLLHFVPHPEVGNPHPVCIRVVRQ